MATQHVDVDILARFLVLANELKRNGSWRDDWTVLRHSATSLPLSEVEPLVLAERFRAAIAELTASTRWWQPANGSVRYAIAASLVRQAETAEAFLAEANRVRKMFRAARLPRASVSEYQAFITLRESAGSGRVTHSQVARMRELFTAIKKDHRWLLGAGEYPTIALLSTTEIPASEIARRVETILMDLEKRGFGSRGRLMPASQLLFLSPERDNVAADRFQAVWNEFKSQGLRMSAGDYDEVALLAFLPRDAKAIVRLVLEHRDGLATLRPRPGRDIGFSLACSTAFVQLVGGDKQARRIAYTQSAIQIRMVIASRQAAMAAAAS